MGCFSSKPPRCDSVEATGEHIAKQNVTIWNYSNGGGNLSPSTISANSRVQVRRGRVIKICFCSCLRKTQSGGKWKVGGRKDLPRNITSSTARRRRNMKENRGTLEIWLGRTPKGSLVTQQIPTGLANLNWCCLYICNTCCCLCCWYL